MLKNISNVLSRISPIAFCIVVIVLMWTLVVKPLWFQIYNFTLDDSFITFRYAENLRETGTLVWNLGENPPVEGFTSILWVIVVSVIEVIGLDVINSVKIISTMLIFASAVLIFVSVDRSSNSLSKIVLASAAVILFLTNTDLVVHMLSGMETAFAIFLSTIFFTAVTSFNNKLNVVEKFPVSAAVGLSFVGILCSLNRPEFNLAFSVSCAVIIFLHKKYRKEFFKFVLAPYIAIGICYMAWRLSYYGPVLPLPFYIKVASKTFAGSGDVFSFFIRISPLLPWILLSQFSAVSRRNLAPALLGVLSLSIFFMFPEHIMGLANRFMIPLYGALCLIAATGMSKAFEWKDILIWRVAVLLLVLVSMFGIYKLNDVYLGSGIHGYEEGLTNAHIKLGKALGAYGPKHSIAMGDAGAIPYYSKWIAIDTVGLNNRALAQARAKNTYDPLLIMNENPDILVLISTTCDKLTTPNGVRYEKQLFDLAQKHEYNKVGVVKFNPGYYLFLVAKNNDFMNRLVIDLQTSEVFSKCN